jgi:hypothetical protein
LLLLREKGWEREHVAFDPRACVGAMRNTATVARSRK